MNTNRTLSHTLFLLLLVAGAWLGIILQYITAIPNYLEHGKTWSRALVLFFSYFTILTNLMVAVTTSFALLFPHTKFGSFCAKPVSVTAVTLYIVVVGLIYNLVLRPLYNPQGLAKVADETVHSAMPLLYLIYWTAFVVKGTLQWANAVKWLIYPLLYLIYSFLHGSFTGYYPYPFIDVNKIGYAGFWLNSFYMLLVFLCLSIVLVWIDKTMAKRRSAPLAQV